MIEISGAMMNEMFVGIQTTDTNKSGAELSWMDKTPSCVFIGVLPIRLRVRKKYI